MDRPSITPGRSADEAWAPVSKKKGHRQPDTGMLAEVRYEGADGEGDSLCYVPVITINLVITERKNRFIVIVFNFLSHPMSVIL